MESGTYEVVCREISHKGGHEAREVVGNFSILGGDLMDISDELKQSLSQPTLREILHRYDNSPYFFIRKKE